MFYLKKLQPYYTYYTVPLILLVHSRSGTLINVHYWGHTFQLLLDNVVDYDVDKQNGVDIYFLLFISKKQIPNYNRYFRARLIFSLFKNLHHVLHGMLVVN